MLKLFTSAEINLPEISNSIKSESKSHQTTGDDLPSLKHIEMMTEKAKPRY